MANISTKTVSLLLDVLNLFLIKDYNVYLNRLKQFDKRYGCAVVSFERGYLRGNLTQVLFKQEEYIVLTLKLDCIMSDCLEGIIKIFHKERRVAKFAAEFILKILIFIRYI